MDPADTHDTLEVVEDETGDEMMTEAEYDDAWGELSTICSTSSTNSNEHNDTATVAAPPPPVINIPEQVSNPPEPLTNVSETVSSAPEPKPGPSGSQKKTARRRIGVGRVNVVPSVEQEDSNPSSTMSDDSNDKIYTSDNNPKASTSNVNNRSDRLNKTLFDQGTREFMQDFDPSLRNKQKLRKRFGQDGKQQIYADDYSECECLRKNCPGCHFPCKVCQDPRCGHECRNARKWLYSEVIYEGKNIQLRNHRNTNLQ